MAGLAGTITSLNPLVNITDENVSLNNLASGNSIWVNDEFEIIVDPDTPAGASIDFKLDIFQESYHFYSTFNIVILPTSIYALIYNDDSNPDSDGDDDSIFEPGETIELLVRQRRTRNGC